MKTKQTDEKKENKSKWGSPQEYGKLIIKYIPTGEIKELGLGIRRMSYHNELIFCKAWGYDGGNPTNLNNPDNYKLISIIPKQKDTEIKQLKKDIKLWKVISEGIDFDDLKKICDLERQNISLKQQLADYKNNNKVKK